MNKLGWSDWRIGILSFAIIFSILVTLLTYFLYPDLTDVGTFKGAVFASWCAGLMLTVAITSVVAFVSLARPEKEVFQARVRNLLRRQTGPHIDYVVDRFHRLVEPYCETLSRELYVTSHDGATNRLLVAQTTHTRWKSYLDDVTGTFKTGVIYENATLPPDGAESNSLTYLKVDGETIVEKREFTTDIRHELDVIVKPNSQCNVHHRLVYWVQAGTEPNRHKLVRFTRLMQVHLTNQLSARNIVVTSTPDGTKVHIAPGERVRIVDISEREPDTFAYNFRIRVD